MKKLHLLCLLFFFIISSSAYSQTITVRGVVKDPSGETIIAAGVIIKGTTNGVITGLNGEFEIDCPTNAVLVFSAISYQTKEVAVAGQTTLNVVLDYDDDYPIFYGSYSSWAFYSQKSDLTPEDCVNTPLLFYGA